MAKFILPKGETSVILLAFVQDSSATDGSGLSGLDQTSSITGGYCKRNGTGVALTCDENVTTEGTYEAPSTAAKVRIGTPANMRAGTYEFHFHNDLFTTADYVMITLGGATNMADIIFEIQLSDFDVNDGVRAGLTALPNAAAEATGGLITGTSNQLIAANFATGSINSTVIDADAIGSSELATTAVNEIRDAILADSTAFNGASIAAILTDTGTTLDNHLTDIKGTGFAKDTHSLTDVTADVTGLAGAAMRGTDSAALASVCTEARLAELDAANLPADVDAILTDTGTTLDGKIDTIDTNVDSILVDTGTTLDGKIDTIDTNVDSILVDTAEIGTAGAGLTAVSRAINPQSNQAFSNIMFEMYDSTNHNPATGKTVTGTRSIDGAAYEAVGGTIAEISNGTYQFDALAADMNGAMVTFRFSNADCDDTFVHVKTSA